MYLRAKSNDFVSLYVLAIEFFNSEDNDGLLEKRNMRNIHKEIQRMCPQDEDLRECYNGLMNLWMRYMLSRNIIPIF
jgi:hypothetical protein